MSICSKIAALSERFLFTLCIVLHYTPQVKQSNDGIHHNFVFRVFCEVQYLKVYRFWLSYQEAQNGIHLFSPHSGKTTAM